MTGPHYQLQNDRLLLRLLEKNDAPKLLAAYSDNKQFLKPWEPTRSEDFYTLDYMRAMIGASYEQAREDLLYSFGIFLKSTGELIGRITLSGIIRGAFQSANVGYFLAEKHNGQGYMTDAVHLVVRFAFQELHLHRVAAATLLHNHGSMRVLEKAGFRREGLARHYLKIDNVWQDHYLFAITVEDTVSTQSE
ncbi:MAG TPA: GNAT family N-acetyltransferase [Chloroflexia bacterium]|nr:GNAT family N-acetyltransferase [Chloroflexia bacterium]